jgi:hypothetical protein
MRIQVRTALGALAVAVWLVASACKYDPKLGEGELRCSAAGECPRGYTCGAGFCHSKGGGNSAGASAYVGNWQFGSTASVMTTCSDGTNSTNSLADPNNQTPMKIKAGPTGGADLDSFWLCDLYLNVDTTGAHLASAAGDCTATFPATGTQLGNSYWTVDTFDVLTSDGKNATHHATYIREDDYLTGDVVMCNQTVQAPLTKN